MGLISELATTINDSMIVYIQTVFTAATSPLLDLLRSVGIVGLLYIGLNHILQFQTISLSTYLFWVLRYLMIVAFLTIWANFKGVYDVFVGIPDGYSAILISAIRETMPITVDGGYLIDPSVIKDTYTGMDEFGNAIVNIAYEFLRDLSLFNIGKSIRNIFLGILILIIGGGFIAACAITVIVAKVGFAVAVSLAPLAIVMLMLEQTRSYFQSWMQLAVSFLVLPLLTSALMSIILYLASQVLINVDAENTHQIKYFGFILIMLSALYLLFKLPMMAGTLASTSVAAAGASTLKAGAMMAGGLGMSMAAGSYGLAKSGTKKLYGAAQRVRDAVDVGRTARKGGASKSRTAWAMLNGMRQSAVARQDRRDRRLAGRLGDGNQSPRRTRAERGGGEAGSNGTSSGGEKRSTGSQSTDAWENSPDRKRGTSSSSTSDSSSSSSQSSASSSNSDKGQSSSNQARSERRSSKSSNTSASKGNHSTSAADGPDGQGQSSRSSAGERKRESGSPRDRATSTGASPVSSNRNQSSAQRTDSYQPSSSTKQRSEESRRHEKSETKNGDDEG
jgi:type IV secretion system protein VirB6